VPERLRPHHRDEKGSVLVLVLIISFVLVGSLAIALTTSTSNLTLSGQYGSTMQASFASQSGINAELTAMRNVNTYTSFPCSLTGSFTIPGAVSSYSVSVQYAAGATALPCTGSTLGGAVAPTTATLTSTGKAPQGSQTVIQANVAIAASGTTLSQALGYAIFTSSNLDLLNAATISQLGPNPPPNVYAGQILTCANGTSSQGALITYDPVTLSNACSFTGSLTADGQVTMQNSAHVGGAVTAYGGGITMTGNPSITGNATATGGGISLSNSSTIGGNADASGSITLSGSSTIGGTKTANDPTLASQTIPPPISFPILNPAVTDWQSAGWNVVQIPSVTYPTCASYFQNLSSGASDPFMTQISTAAGKTAIYAPTCAVTYSRSHVFTLSADVALQVQSLTLQNSNTFYSTSTVVHNFSVLANASSTCSTSTVDVNLSNSSDFVSPTPSTNATLNVFIYTPGEVDYANAPSMNGQILACGGFTGENGFALNFVPGAAATLPWTGTTTSPPTVTVLQKFVVKG